MRACVAKTGCVMRDVPVHTMRQRAVGRDRKSEARNRSEVIKLITSRRKL